MTKRFFDIIFSALGLMFLAPLFLVIAVCIKRESPGPVFYRGLRVGRNFRPFRMFKFRSMVIDADRIGGPSTRQGDPRLTNIGKFLRRYKLDELPQLINVFLGQMSLVGPRPEVPEYAKLYQNDERKIFSIRPGMTDYASLWDFHEEERLAEARSTEEAEHTYLTQIRPQKIALQMKYIKEQSFWTDSLIILKTFQKLFL